MDNIYLDNLQLILNSEATEEEKQNQLLDLIKSIENDLLLGSKEKENLLNQIKSTSTNIMLNLDLYNLIKLRKSAKKFLIAYSSVALGMTGLTATGLGTIIAKYEEIKNSSDYLLVFLVICCSFIAAMYGYLSYQELQEYLDYNKEINSYQRRLKDNHR